MSFTKQEKAKLHLLRIKQVQSKIARMKRWRDKIDVFAALANVSQIASGVMMFFILGPNTHGVEYLVVPDLIAGFGQSLNISLQATVQTFAFFGYAALGLRALWDLGVTFHRVFFVHSTHQVVRLNPMQPSITLPTKTHLLGRTTANLLIAAFNIIAVITVLGLFSTGVGLLFAAIATGISWVKDSVIPWYRTREALQELRYELSQMIRGLPEGLLSPPLDLQREKITYQIDGMERECHNQRNSMILNAISFLAFALFVTGPFGFPTLGMAGSVLLVACTTVGIARIIYNSCKKNSVQKEVVKTQVVKLDEESELEFHQRMKLNHWMEETSQKLDNKCPNAEEDPVHYPPIIQIQKQDIRLNPEVAQINWSQNLKPNM